MCYLMSLSGSFIYLLIYYNLTAYKQTNIQFINVKKEKIVNNNNNKK